MKRQLLLAPALALSLAAPAFAQDQAAPAPPQQQAPAGAVVRGQGTVEVRPAEPEIRIESAPAEVQVETTGEPQIRVVEVPTIAGRMPEDVVGWNVRNAAGEDIGEVRDFVTEPGSPAITSLVMSRTRLLGLGEELVTLPWDRVQVDPQGNALIATLNEEELDNAPEFEYGAEAGTIIGPERNDQ
ncbi:PRC-barrel domain-containing protein [Skermanella mucosa]|uniref:PRC-barrel domain-containing protein n=1 Tax=Skermanella mucosa TaxID=1789672 RepID=UPI00192B6783|nr:PRC-barrel domain-containing protein [Skermanella mucosa]UEM22914.1 PRC-barrel domain-containing protein [Skermanella mucosa]